MDYTPVNITTVLMFCMTLYLIIGRFRSRPDASWPLFYYLFLVIYHQAQPDVLDDYAVYSGVVSALFIRFEFLHSRVSIIIRFCELVILVYIAWRFYEVALQ